MQQYDRLMGTEIEKQFNKIMFGQFSDHSCVEVLECCRERIR
jgi:hypothetical protein